MIAKAVLSLIALVAALPILPEISFSASAPLPKSTEKMLKKLKLAAGGTWNN